MQIIADLHTHTNVTDHAFSTLTEMVQAAEDRGYTNPPLQRFGIVLQNVHASFTFCFLFIHIPFKSLHYPKCVR